MSLSNPNSNRIGVGESPPISTCNYEPDSVLKAKRDGLTIANAGGALVANAVLGARGVKYDVNKLIYLGSGNSRTTYLFPIRSEAGFDTLEKLQAASGVRIGAMSIGHTSYIHGRLFAWLLDLKDPRYVVGYSGPELDIALLRGEVDARSRSAASVLHRKWLEQKLVDVSSALLEIPKGHRWPHTALRDVRTLESFTRNALERKVLKMQRLFRLVGSPYLLPPGVPKERVEILRTAFRNTFKDPELEVVWKKLTGGVYAPLSPEEQEKAVRSIPRDPETLKLFKQIAGAGPLPPR